jgi:hypothetical protein
MVLVLLLPMVRLRLLRPASLAESCPRVRALGQPLWLLASVRPPNQRGRTLPNELSLQTRVALLRVPPRQLKAQLLAAVVVVVVAVARVGQCPKRKKKRMASTRECSKRATNFG